MGFFPAPKLVNGKTLKDERTEKRAAVDAYWRHVCAIVDRRDHGRCRVCGKYCSPTALTFKDRAERHHLIPSGLQGPDETWNVLTLCWSCHQEGRHGLNPTLQLEGHADERDLDGYLCGVKVKRLTESGWQVVAWV